MIGVMGLRTGRALSGQRGGLVRRRHGCRIGEFADWGG